MRSERTALKTTDGRRRLDDHRRAAGRWWRPHPRRFPCLVVALGVVLLLVQGTTWRSTPLVTAQVAPNDRLGIDHVNLMALNYPADVRDQRLDERYQRAVAAGAGWTRYEIRWDRIESQDGFDYRLADEIVRRDVAYGLQVNAILNATPDAYATAGLTGVPGPRVGQRRFTPAQLAGLASAASPPVNLYEPIFADGTDEPAPNKPINPNNYWARFVRKTVQRYMPGGLLAQQEGWPEGTGIRVWEIWNEPDRPFWTGSIEDYYRLLKVAYLTIKSTDPQATVLLAGLAYWEDPNWPPSRDWFPRFLQVVKSDPDPDLRDAYNQYFDATAWHWYSNPRHLYEKTLELQDLMRQYGVAHKEMWVNESGVPIWDELPPPYRDPDSPFRATAEEQAAWVVQAFAEGFAAGVQRIFFFQLYDDCGNGPDAWDWFGLIRNPIDAVGEKACGPHPEQPGEPRPAYRAYQVAADVFRDVQPVWRYHDYATGLGRVALFRPPDERVLVLWNWSFEDKRFDIVRTGPTGELIDLEGNRRTIAPEGGVYRITLPAATNANWNKPGAMIGGRPYILIEQDTLTPTARLETLPETSPPTFQVTWDVQDWGTGVTAYEVLYSDGRPQTSEDWQVLVPETPVDPPKPRLRGSATFTGEEGRTYYFAVRARDRAGNWSPVNAPQTWTTVRATGFIGGRVFNLRTQPLASATVQVRLNTTTIATATTDVEGRFVVANVPLDSEYGVVAAAEGFGSWPPRWGVTPLSTVTFQVELHLPPAINMISNGSFEAGELEGWARGGDTLPIRSSFLRLSGQGSALLGFRSDNAAPGASRLSQVVAIPGHGEPTLGFWYRVYRRRGTPPVPSPNRFRVVAEPLSDPARAQVLYTEFLTDRTSWIYQWVDLSPLAGEVVQLTFEVIQPDADFQTVVYLDDVAVGTATPFHLRQRLFLPLVAVNRQ